MSDDNQPHATDPSGDEEAIEAYGRESRDERRFRKLLRRGRRPSEQLAVEAAKLATDRAHAFLESRSAELVGRGFASFPPLYSSSAVGAPVFVYLDTNDEDPPHAKGSFWLLPNTGYLWPAPTDRPNGVSAMELASSMEAGEFNPIEGDLATLITELAEEQQAALDADPTVPSRLAAPLKPGTPIRAQPDTDTEIVGELLESSLLAVYEADGDWLRVQVIDLGAEGISSGPGGWVPADAVSPN